MAATSAAENGVPYATTPTSTSKPQDALANGAINGASNGHSTLQSRSNGTHSSVPRLPLSYDVNDSDKSATRLVMSTCPEWDGPGANISFIRCKDGITNTLLKVVNEQPGLTEAQIDASAVLLRAYGPGTHVIIDREREAENHELLWSHNLAPELLARFQNGMLYRYIRGTVAVPDKLQNPALYIAVANRLAMWHATIPCIPSTKPSPEIQIAPGLPGPNLWTVMQKWIKALPDGGDKQRERKKLLQAELESLVLDFRSRPQSSFGENGLVFAHCDLLCGNIIVEPPQGADGDEHPVVSFIDYEYATPSPAAFDIANHFAEWAGFECRYEALPTISQRRNFIRSYVQAYYDNLPLKPELSPDVDAEAVKLESEVDLYRGIPGLYWGIWALIQADISDIDFDYASYAEIRLDEYWAWKAEEDGSRKAADKDLPFREKMWFRQNP